jgi:Bacterial Ig-like domain (group 2)
MGHATWRSFRPSLLAAAVASACSGSPTNPCVDQYGRGNNSPMVIELTCTSVGVNAQCNATPLYGLYTYCPQPLPTLTWTSSNNSVATVSATGFVTVLAHGQVDITASPTSGYLQPAIWTALVDPQVPPQPLGELLVVVNENDGTTKVPGVFVEILDSYNAGRTAVTNQFGSIIFDRLLPATFTVRASKSGYVTATMTFRFDQASSPSLFIRMERSSS